MQAKARDRHRSTLALAMSVILPACFSAVVFLGGRFECTRSVSEVLAKDENRLMPRATDSTQDSAEVCMATSERQNPGWLSQEAC